MFADTQHIPLRHVGDLSEELSQVRVRYRQQPEESNAREIVLTPAQLSSLKERKLFLRELLETIQANNPVEAHEVNAVYLWNFTTGLYEPMDANRVVENTHLKKGLIDLILVWRPPMSPESSPAASTEVASLKIQLNNLKELVKEMLKSPVFVGTTELQSQVSKNFEKELVDDLVLAPIASALMTRKEDLDFAFLFSNPLVARNPQGGVSSLNEPVNFSRECNDIIQRLEEKKMKFNVEIQRATQSDFLKVLRRKPKILHIMSHGSVEIIKSNTVYFLEFEGENGEQFQMTQDIMERDLERMGMSLDFVELAYVNSCHSEVPRSNPRKWAKSC